MKIVFDNNVPDPLRRALVGHKVMLAREMHWDTLTNGLLLKAAEDAGFELMITGDKNLAYQQNLKTRRIALIVLGATRWSTLKEALSPISTAVARAKPGSFEHLATPPYVPKARRAQRI